MLYLDSLQKRSIPSGSKIQYVKLDESHIEYSPVLLARNVSDT